MNKIQQNSGYSRRRSSAAHSILLACTCAPLFGQTKELKLQAFDGKSGRSLPNERLLLFGGPTEQDARFHKVALEATTDAAGNARITFNPSQVRYLQVFPDFLTPCYRGPNDLSISVSEIVGSGGSTPNICSAFRVSPTPGTLVIYARKPSLAEKMAR